MQPRDPLFLFLLSFLFFFFSTSVCKRGSTRHGNWHRVFRKLYNTSLNHYRTIMSLFIGYGRYGTTCNLPNAVTIPCNLRLIDARRIFEPGALPLFSSRTKFISIPYLPCTHRLPMVAERLRISRTVPILPERRRSGSVGSTRLHSTSR